MFKNNNITKILTILLVLVMLFIIKESSQLASVVSSHIENTETNTLNNTPTIVIDAGHGGIDPGKVGINGALEKDINLAIALKLEKLLKASGINIVMTRTEDKGLYSENDSNKKVQDMKNRLAIIEDAEPVLAVSIHQNSYPDESVSGVQVFYYSDSLKGKEAAEIMQKQMIKTLEPEKEREAKDNKTYYLLKKTSVPLLIIECAFMSNPKEANLLTQNDYQEKVAWSIYLGIMQSINTK